MEKRKVENYRNLWFKSQTKTTYLLTSADENNCDDCKNFKWIINIQLKISTPRETIDTIISKCQKCLEKSDIICKQQDCPFSNSTKKESINICQNCCDVLIENTKKIYEETI
jgi:hypothetical protein